ncbi:hypothetical protein NNJEOMEG_00363 [Fundidesulfovibrio magnetotacticus]|uniref:J domain-containing protein n=2 Tax=Fundidesulfovibrio magnetotacticus TaxID=2730080 RepID=A0A6V8LQC8_9BACT|nr:hypothetical protein NNJEOMEG_00363 [Fundidesulfovibrio magnetotacticus]
MAPDDPRRMGVQGGAGDPAGASRVPVSRMGEAPREVAQAPASAPPGVAPGPASRLPEALRVALRPESLAMLAVFLGVAALAALARARKRQPRPNVRARRGVAASEAGGEAAPERDRVRFAPDDARQVREREVRRRTDEDWLRADRERFVRMRREEVREERLRAEAERRRAEAERGRAGERRRNDGQGPRADSSRTGGSGRDGAGLEGSRDVKDREWARRILGVPPGATPGEVRKAYIAGMKANHPDQASTLGEEVQALFSERAKLLNIAYDILRDQDA